MSLTIPPPHSFLTTDDQGIDLFPTSTELTVAQAAAVLDMPEDCIYEMIKVGILLSRQEGSQYWIDRDRLFEYKEDTERGRVWLAELARESQEMWPHNMEFNLEEYNATRKAIREANRCS